MTKWRWAITWDNAIPQRNSDPLRMALQKLGKVKFPQTRTSALLAPSAGVKYGHLRAALVLHLHPRNGNVFYANLRTGQAFQRGAQTRNLWRSL